MAPNHDPQKTNDEADAERSDYAVGYKKPPKATRFHKGQSGNPQGRPTGVQNFKTDLDAELKAFVRITEGGEVRTLTRQKALIKRAMEKALKGEMRAIEAIAKWCQHYLDEAAGNDVEAPLPAHDQAILARALHKMKDADFSKKEGE